VQKGRGAVKNKHTEKPKIEVSAEPRFSEADPACEITLSIIDGSNAVKLSPAEVRELARQLLDAEHTAGTVKELPPSHQWLLRDVALLVDNQVFLEK
jgi:hypothetical protein